MSLCRKATRQISRPAPSTGEFTPTFPEPTCVSPNRPQSLGDPRVRRTAGPSGDNQWRHPFRQVVTRPARRRRYNGFEPRPNFRMRTLYRRWMEDWENRLCFRTNNRVVRPFEWGLDWAQDWPVHQRLPAATGMIRKRGCASELTRDPEERRILRLRPAFRFPSRWRHAAVHFRRANTLSPKTTPSTRSGIPRRITRAGPWSSCRIGTPFLTTWRALPRAEEVRDLRPAAEPPVSRCAHAAGVASRRLCRLGEYRPDYRCDPAGRGRRPVLCRLAAEQGYTRLGILGTSLGSCYAFLASAHDPRFR